MMDEKPAKFDIAPVGRIPRMKYPARCIEYFTRVNMGRSHVRFVSVLWTVLYVNLWLFAIMLALSTLFFLAGSSRHFFSILPFLFTTAVFIAGMFRRNESLAVEREGVEIPHDYRGESRLRDPKLLEPLIAYLLAAFIWYIGSPFTGLLLIYAGFAASRIAVGEWLEWNQVIHEVQDVKSLETELQGALEAGGFEAFRKKESQKWRNPSKEEIDQASLPE